MHDLPKYAKAGILALILLLVIFYFFGNPDNNGLFPECVFHSVTGLYCPGCGSQRAVHCLLHLDLKGVASNNLLFLPGLAVIFYGIFLSAVNKKLGTHYRNFLYHKRAPLYIFIIIVLFAVLRNLPYYPFTLLAPG